MTLYLLFLSSSFLLNWIIFGIFKEYNNTAIDMRDDDDTKAELHQQLEVRMFKRQIERAGGVFTHFIMVCCSCDRCL